MRIKKKYYFWIGIGILALLIFSYFININYLSNDGDEINTPLLGLLIFYNKFVFVFYILIAAFLIWKGIGKKIKFG